MNTQRDLDIFSLASSDSVNSATLGSSSESKDVDVVGDESVSTESSQPNSSPAYGEMPEVMVCATKKLDFVWSRERQRPTRGRLDVRSLGGHGLPSFRSLPFLVEGVTEYARMPPVEETLVS